MGLSPLREQAHQFGSLALSCGEFVAIHQGTAYAGHAASSPEGTGQTPTPGAMGTHPLPQLPLVTCPPSASLRQVVKRMSEECVHHLRGRRADALGHHRTRRHTDTARAPRQSHLRGSEYWGTRVGRRQSQ